MGGQKINRHFIIAHQVEARPIIEFYRLTKDITHRAFSVYENDHIKLVISGEGKVLCAAATAYIGSLRDKISEPAMWVNAGVAGHAFHPVGSLWRVNKVIDSISTKIIFPTNILLSSDVIGEALVTVDKPETIYPEDALYDMEASAFFQTASRFASLEYINSFKVVSDNKNQPLSKLSLSLAARIIEERIEEVDNYLRKLENKLIIDFNKIVQYIELKRELSKKYKFTYAQQLQCDELLKALAVHGEKCGQELLQHTQSKQVLDSLSNRLKKVQLAV